MGALLLVALAGCSRQSTPPPAAQAAAAAAPVPSTRISLAVPNRSNAAVSAASWGQTVAVVWTASTDTVSDLFLSVSADGGTTFGPPVRVNDTEGDVRASGEQAARVAIGASRVIHVAWPSKRQNRAVILYASSSDNGKTFSRAEPIADAKLSGARGWHALALGYDGAVHAVWLDGRNAAPGGEHHHSHATAGAATPMKAAAGDSGPRQDIFHAKWKAGEARTERSVAANVCFCCKTAIVASGEQIYVAWRHIFPGSVRDIALARSNDNGLTFGAPERVSDDGWKLDGCPDDGPAIATDSHGGIHLAWPTLVPGATPHKGIFYASTSGGQGVSPRLRLDSGDTDPAHPQIAAEMHGASAVVWDERAGSTRRIVLRRVVKGAAEPPLTFDGAGASYPVVAAGDGFWITLWSADGADGKSVLEGRRIPFPTEH